MTKLPIKQATLYVKPPYITPLGAARFMEAPHFERTIWLGVDLDGTLVRHNPETFDPLKIGKPIPQMVNRVKFMLQQGITVRIFTARVSGPSSPQRDLIASIIMNWCIDTFGQRLDVTCVKDYYCAQIWDDKAVSVETNTGNINNQQRDIL
jgi:hypothetical protein